MARRARAGPYSVLTCDAPGRAAAQRSPLEALAVKVAERQGLVLLVGSNEKALVFTKRWFSGGTALGGIQHIECRCQLLCAKSLGEVRW